MWYVVCLYVCEGECELLSASASCNVPQAPQAPPSANGSNKGGKLQVCRGQALLWAVAPTTHPPPQVPPTLDSVLPGLLRVARPPGLPAFCHPRESSRRGQQVGDSMPSSPPLPSREDGCLAVGRGQHVAPTCPPAGLHMTNTRKTSCQGQAPSMQATPRELRGGWGGLSLGHPLFQAPRRAGQMAFVRSVTQGHFTFRPLTELFPNKHLR